MCQADVVLLEDRKISPLEGWFEVKKEKFLLLTKLALEIGDLNERFYNLAEKVEEQLNDGAGEIHIDIKSYYLLNLCLTSLWRTQFLKTFFLFISFLLMNMQEGLMILFAQGLEKLRTGPVTNY
ncbi:uncharacterized protein LOC133713766 [Rosa rugosa]|uniref:uncharacterized protein LOC133713766 n=1 Tax=Rosa rugosa TaxID=74645 RepID=UPI002B4057D4|nr:uncharacterized protein LOC133713766 [Rosa rugosa]